jgi:hypothetical protein
MHMLCANMVNQRGRGRERERERYPEKVHQDPHVLQELTYRTITAEFERSSNMSPNS